MTAIELTALARDKALQALHDPEPAAAHPRVMFESGYKQALQDVYKQLQLCVAQPVGPGDAVVGAGAVIDPFRELIWQLS